MDVSNKASAAQAGGSSGGGKSPLMRLFEFVLLASGVVSLIGIDQDLIRWSEVANWAVEAYRSVVAPVRAWLGGLFNWEIPPLAADLFVLFSVIIAAANVHSLRNRGELAFARTIRLVFIEQILHRDAGHLLTERDERYAQPAALIAIIMTLAATLMLVLPAFHLSPWIYYPLAAYIVVGFALISQMDVDSDTPVEERPKKLRRFILVSLLFLPAAVTRYVAFAVYCLLIILMSAWRWYLYVAAAYLAVLALNEAYLRFVKTWEVKPDCVLYSVAETCASPGVEKPKT